jgi:DNA-binding MarR family transcriptional regulator
MADLRRVFNDIIRFETELWNAVEDRLRTEHGLLLSWFEPMQVIARRGGCRVQDIAADLSITVGGTSKLVDRIEAAGHCRRRPHPADGRSSLIELTPSGARLLTRATTTFDEELSGRLAGPLGPDGLHAFATAVATLRAAGRSPAPPERTTP